VASAPRDAKRRARSAIGSAWPGVGNGMKYMRGAAVPLDDAMDDDGRMALIGTRRAAMAVVVERPGSNRAR
jgi:hypothetical protein